ncbi:MAG TPA: AAA family ATPase [Pirellulales bacterium]
MKTAITEMRGDIEQMASDPDQHTDLNLPVLAYSYSSLEWLPDYATLNHKHIIDVREVLQNINRYRDDPSLSRPLNFLLLASPGSGKSQLIKSLVKQIGNQFVGYVPYNMATMQGKDDLGRVLDAARNITIEGKLPIVFLDEFDSHDSNYPLLLPLLWDGELDVGNRELRLGRVVFFLAGSRSKLPEKLRDAREMASARNSGGKDDDTKLADLFSRINGTVVKLPSLADVDVNTTSDKIVIAMQLLRRRFPKCKTVPWTLLWFIAQAPFRYEARSIATLINLIAMRKGETADALEALGREHLGSLPFGNADILTKSPLGIHLNHDRGASGLVALWADASQIQADQELLVEPMKFDPPNWATMLQKRIASLTSQGRLESQPFGDRSANPLSRVKHSGN